MRVKAESSYKGYNVGWFKWSIFFKLSKLFFSVVAKCDLVHDVETMHGLCLMLISSENLF